MLWLIDVEVLSSTCKYLHGTNPTCDFWDDGTACKKENCPFAVKREDDKCED